MRLRTCVSAIIFILATALYAQTTVSETNAWRIEQGLHPLVELEALNFFCTFFAGVNAMHGTISHDFLSQEDKAFVVAWAAIEHDEPIPRETYECLYVGPVLTLPRDKARVWISSPPHRDIILRPDVLFIGTGIWYEGNRMFMCTAVAK